ncbi:MAG: LysE family translocator [Bacteroidia bacterium]
MIYLIVIGLITGIVVSFSFGAGFFSIIRTSISKGKNKAFLISLGLIISDLMFILLAIFATNFISYELLKYQYYIRIVGMAVLVSLGLYLIRKSVKQYNNEEILVQNRPAYAYIAKGFIINSLNPLTIITWIGATLFIQTAVGFSIIKIAVFFTSILFSLVATQYYVCYFAQKLGKWLSPKSIHKINITAGVIIIMLGLLLYVSKNVETTSNPVDKVNKMIQKGKRE